MAEIYQNKTRNKLPHPALILLLLCLLTYGSIVSHQFMLDDIGFRQMAGASPFRNFNSFFTQTVSRHYEPLNNLLNISLFKLFRAPSALYSINLGLFYLNCLLIFAFIFLISQNYPAAYLTGILFCLHPVNAENLQHITLNIIFLAAILMLLSLISLYFFLERSRKLSFYFLSLLSFTAALLCQEISVVFPFYAASLIFFLTGNLKKTIKLSLPFFILSLAQGILWLSLAGAKAHLARNIQVFNLTLWNYPANLFLLLKWYVGKLFYPDNIVFMYNLLPTNKLVWLWNMLFVISLSAVGILIVRFSKRIEGFALTMFTAGFLVAIPASLARPWMGLVVEPYWFYFSSIGFFLFIALMLLKLRNLSGRPYLNISLIVLLPALFIQTQKVNNYSKTEFGYYNNWLKNSPRNLLAIYALSDFYIAKPDLKIPAEFASQMADSFDNYLKLASAESAIKFAEKFLAAKIPMGQRQDLLARLAVLYYQKNNTAKTRETIQRFWDETAAPAGYIKLSHVFNEMGSPEMAVKLLEECIQGYPRYKESYLLLGVILGNQGRYKKSIAWWSQGQEIDAADNRFTINIKEAQQLLQNNPASK